MHNTKVSFKYTRDNTYVFSKKIMITTDFIQHMHFHWYYFIKNSSRWSVKMQKKKKKWKLVFINIDWSQRIWQYPGHITCSSSWYSCDKNNSSILGIPSPLSDTVSPQQTPVTLKSLKSYSDMYSQLIAIKKLFLNEICILRKEVYTNKQRMEHLISSL